MEEVELYKRRDDKEGHAPRCPTFKSLKEKSKTMVYDSRDLCNLMLREKFYVDICGSDKNEVLAHVRNNL